MNRFIVGLIVLLSLSYSCKKDKVADKPSLPLSFTSLSVDGSSKGFDYENVNLTPTVTISFSKPVSEATIKGAITLRDNKNSAISLVTSLQNEGATVLVSPADPLEPLNKYRLTVSNELVSTEGNKLVNSIEVSLLTGIDSTDKFPRIPDDELLTLVQRQTFKYFWDFAHPTSGLARERNTSGDIVTTGGTGFGVMAIVTGIHRNFITRAEGLERVHKIVNFLKNRADRFHGAFPHWLNGNTGKVQPFSAKDNGADLVETSFLMQGLLTARQYFNAGDPSEILLRNNINDLWNAVEWSWFRKNNENVLYWHWSPSNNWEMDHQIRGWNEGLITYILAASSQDHSIPKVVYDQGFANSGAIRNGGTFYGHQLPLGSPNGGPLFFAHYSFLGVSPRGLVDQYVDYEAQNTAHSLIQYQYSISNPRGYLGYSENCWGLTASDDINGYLAHEINNDNGVISPTAALSSFPYTPAESMKALKFFYYKLGDRIWKEYGFVDAFSLEHAWFADSYLAIDQGPIIIMIENHRSSLLWDLFMSSPEIIKGMKTLGFQSPYL